jgi:hypothetical protein
MRRFRTAPLLALVAALTLACGGAKGPPSPDAADAPWADLRPSDLGTELPWTLNDSLDDGRDANATDTPGELPVDTAPSPDETGDGGSEVLGDGGSEVLGDGGSPVDAEDGDGGPDVGPPQPFCGDGQCLGTEGCGSCPEDCGPCDPLASLPFHAAIFRATHNSYSGDINGERGTFVQQLDSGIRFLELDFHDAPWNLAAPDYLVGHDGPGSELWTAGSNPDTPALESWLTVVDNWSKAHPDHLPITVLLDAKDDLTDNPDRAHGNLAFLNDLLLDVFGEARLYAAEELGAAWPSVAGLRGKVLAVLSGNFDTRQGYLRDQGFNPAAAMNDAGKVVEVHDSGSGHLWYWTGQYLPDGGIRWHRHGRYDTGADPAVALNNQGWIVEVHSSENKATLWCTVGKLGADYEIQWGDAVQYDTGTEPTIRFLGLNGTALHEVHKSEKTGEHWDWQATLNTAAKTIAWGAHGKTSVPLYEEEKAVSGKGTVTVSTGTDSVFSAVLRWSTGAGKSGRIRYRQLLFVENQKGDSPDLALDGVDFFATGASTASGTVSWVESKLATKGLVRLWGFASSHTSVPVTYPATDHPYSAWYEAYCDAVGCLDE